LYFLKVFYIFIQTFNSYKMRKKINLWLGIFMAFVYAFTIVFILIVRLFRDSVQNWYFEHFSIMLFAFLIFLFLVLIRVFDFESFVDEIEKNENLDLYLILFLVQFLISLNLNEEIKFLVNENAPTYVRILFLYMPTIIIILRHFFGRFVKIEKMLKELKNKNENL